MPHSFRRHPAPVLLAALAVLAAYGNAAGRMTSPHPARGPSHSSTASGPYTITRVSGAGAVGSTDPANKFNNGSSWINAYIVPPLAAYAPPIAGSHYIAKTPTLSTLLPPGTTTFRTTFSLPAGFTAPSLSISVHADNYATILVNGHVIGGHPLNQSYTIQNNFQGSPEIFASSNAGFFVPGNNFLEINLTNVGSTRTGTSPAALDYKATVQFYCKRGMYQNGSCMRKKNVVVGPETLPSS